MKIEMRGQKPGDVWPSGEPWEVANPENLRAICAELTPAEIVEVMRWAGPNRRAAHVIAEQIEAVLKKRGDDVMIVHREVVKVRKVSKGTDGDRRLREMLDAPGPREEAAAKALRFYAPALTAEDAASLASGTKGLIDPIEVQDTVREFYEAMGPVEIMAVDDPGQPA